MSALALVYGREKVHSGVACCSEFPGGTVAVLLKLHRLLLLALLPLADRSFGTDWPLKLGVDVSSHSVQRGEKIVIQVGLLNAVGQLAKAPKPISVSLQARLASGAVESLQTVEIPAGQSFKSVAATLPGSGLVYVWARHSELLPGGEFVRVREAESYGHPAPSAPAVAGNKAPLASSVLPLPPRPLPQITLRYSPDREFLADGKDAVIIEAFLMGANETFPSDIRLNVYDSSNTLKPTPLTIPAGQPIGQSVLTSSQPRAVTVEFLGSSPPAEFQGDKKLNIRFVPPITHLDLLASPPRISLLDTADLIVTLTDDERRPLTTNAPRHVAFSIISGRGAIEQRDLEVSAGQFEVRTKFVPEWPGQVTVSSSTPNLLTVTTPMQVSVPITLLLCSSLGGLVGGLLSRRTRRKSNQWRIPIGIATGFLFYWACIFLGFTATKREVVLNPLSALALSAIGGWLQTEVFTIIWGAIRPRTKA
jgi:hypothetical protein